MKISRKSLMSGAEEARGITVVIDVLRAFTCSALMFHFGLRELHLVKDADRALEIKDSMPGSIAVGEVKGVKYPGYDFGNSPAELWQAGPIAFRDRVAVMRSSAGTQGVIAASEGAQLIILGSYVTAKSIANYIKQHPDNDTITLLAMGLQAKHKSVEDEACADYIESLITGTPYDHMSATWNSITDPYIVKSLRGDRPHMPREDVIIALQRDIFNFVMVADNNSHHEEIVVRKITV